MIPRLLTKAALAIGKLDQRLQDHPLLPAILFRERLEAARACAAVDGRLTDPWRLAAELEGLRPHTRENDAFERGSTVDAAHAAFEQYQWLARPDGYQKTQIAEAVAWIDSDCLAEGALLGAAIAVHRWIEAGRGRSPMHGALVLHWRRAQVLRSPLPLVGARAFAPDAPWKRSEWVPVFLNCLADETAAIGGRVTALEHQWRLARSRSGARRRNSRADRIIDFLAARPIASGTRISEEIGVSLKAAYIYLERFLADGLVVEVTHRPPLEVVTPRCWEPPFGSFTLRLAYDHDAAVTGSRLSSSMTVTREDRLSDHAQKTRFLSFSVAPGAKLGMMMPAVPFAMSALASSHDGGVLPWSARSSQGQAKMAGEKSRLLKLERSVRSRTGSLSTS